MGTTFVTLEHGSTGDEPGFWMRDGMLELWLRLLALHLPEPDARDESLATLTRSTRDKWLLASRGYFNGCVPHGLEDAVSTVAGRKLVSDANESLLTALTASKSPLALDTLNLIGIDGVSGGAIDRQKLIDIGNAFRDLLAGRIRFTASSVDMMPGSTPYDVA